MTELTREKLVVMSAMDIVETVQPKETLTHKDYKEFMAEMRREVRRMIEEDTIPGFYLVKLQCRNCWDEELTVVPCDISDEEYNNFTCDYCKFKQGEVTEDMAR